MTVSENVSPKVIVVGPYAIGDTIPITFEYTEYNDIKIDVDGSALVYNQDYEVYLQSVTLKVAVAANKKVTVYRDTPLDQQAEFPQNRKFNSAKMDDALDKLCMQNQEQQEKLNRAILAPISEEDFNGTLPTPKANEVLQWNSTANQLINYDLRGEIKAIDDKVDEAISTAGGATSIANAATATANSAVLTANSATAAANNAVSTANTASSNATAAVNTANAADTKANTAISTANEASSTAAGAVVTANSAASQAAEASDTADEAKEIAEGIDGKATQALSTANTAASQVAEAKAKADAAKAAADAVVGTAAEAKATATEAKTTANTAKTTADSVDAKAQEALDKVNEVVSKKLPNVVMTSGLTANGGILSGFNSTQYAKFPFVVDLDESDFEIDFKFTTSDNVIDTQAIIDSRFGLAVYIDTYNLQMCLSSTGESWDIGTDRGSHRLEENTTYYCKLTFEDDMYILSISEDDITYEIDITTAGLAGLYPRTIYIGGGNEAELGAAFPLDGTIDLNFAKLIIDDEVKWNGMDITGLATKANVSLSNIDSEGQAKFDAKQDTLVSGTNIKTINNTSILGSGDIEIKSAPDLDNVTISKNSSEELQAIGVIDGKTNNADKFVTLTKAEYDSLTTKDSDTFYNITDDTTSSGSSGGGGASALLLQPVYLDHTISDTNYGLSSSFDWIDGNVYTKAYNQLVSDFDNGSEVIEASDYVRPNFGSNEGYSHVITSSAEYNSDYKAYKAVDGNYETCWFSNQTGSGAWWKMTFPRTIIITGLVFCAGGYQKQEQPFAGRFYTDETKTTAIGNSFSGTYKNGAEVTISDIPSTGIEADSIYLYCTNVYNSGMGELRITAKYKGRNYVIGTNGRQILDVDEAVGLTDKDYFFILDKTNKRFKLPRCKQYTDSLTQQIGVQHYLYFYLGGN